MGKVTLVTGANGFVGRHLIHRLSQDKERIIVATDVQDALIPLSEKERLTVYRKGDLSERAVIEQLKEEFRFDCIINLAAVLSQAADMETYFSIMNSNIRATFLLLEIAKSHKARFIFPSTALVYGNQKGPFKEEMLTDPGDFYSLSKLMCEQLIRFYGHKYDVPSVIFRIGILYGPSQTGGMFIPSLVNALLSHREFPMTPGEQTRDFVYIGDFAAAVEKILSDEKISGTFNIGTGNAPTLKAVAQMAEKIAGVENCVRPGAVPYREKESWEYCLDAGKAKSAFGWNAATDIEHGLADTIDYLKKKGVPHA